LGGLRKPVVVRAVEEKDFKKLTKRRYSFRWRALKMVPKGRQLCLEDEALNYILDKYFYV
jgi:hypothetical protein